LLPALSSKFGPVEIVFVSTHRFPSVDCFEDFESSFLFPGLVRGVLRDCSRTLCICPCRSLGRFEAGRVIVGIFGGFV
jgi:hypothetical protein